VFELSTDKGRHHWNAVKLWTHVTIKF